VIRSKTPTETNITRVKIGTVVHVLGTDRQSRPYENCRPAMVLFATDEGKVKLDLGGTIKFVPHIPASWLHHHSNTIQPEDMAVDAQPPLRPGGAVPAVGYHLGSECPFGD
jgi:hypothetical protein